MTAQWKTPKDPQTEAILNKLVKFPTVRFRFTFKELLASPNVTLLIFVLIWTNIFLKSVSVGFSVGG